MDTVIEHVSDFINFVFPTVVISTIYLSASVLSLIRWIKKDDRLSFYKMFPLWGLGVAYLLSFLSIGSSELRHALIRFFIAWVGIDAFMSQLWGYMGDYTINER